MIGLQLWSGMKFRIETSEQLLKFVGERYRYFTEAFNNESGDLISKFHLKDFAKDMLLIQKFAHDEVKRKNEDGEERPEGMAIL